MSQEHQPPSVTALDHIVLTVADMQKTMDFYVQALGMTAAPFTTAHGETRQSLRFGQMKINLHLHGQEFDPKAAKPRPGSADLCFLTGDPIEAWRARLDALGIPVEEGPVPRTGATGPLMSLYVRDPDGNLIEVSTQMQQR